MRSLSLFILSLQSFVLFGQTWHEIHNDWGKPKSDYTSYGRALAIDGDFAAVGAPYESDTSIISLIGAGAVYMYHKTSRGNWVFTQRITAPFPSFADKFGESIAIHNDYMAIGAPEEDHDENGQNYLGQAGSVFIYKRDLNNQWQLQQKIVPQQRMNSAYFGTAIAMHNNRMIVSSDGRDSRAFVYEKLPGGQWTEVQSLRSTDWDISDNFGCSVALNDSIFVVGAYSEHYDTNSQNYIFEAGAVYVFKKGSANSWHQFQKIVPPGRNVSHRRFGLNVQLTNQHLAVSGFEAEVDPMNPSDTFHRGSLYMLQPNSTGSWIHHQQINSNQHFFRCDYGYYCISISGYDLLAGILGESLDSTNGSPHRNEAYLFKYQAGQWHEEQQLIAHDHVPYDLFGSSVALSGENAVVGAHGRHLPLATDTIKDVGKAYFFERDFIHFSYSADLCEGDSLQFGGSYISATGNYLDTLQDQSGGDSIVEVKLNVYPVQRETIQAYLCPGETYFFNGRHLDSAGLYREYLKSSTGCDSIVNLQLDNKPRPFYSLPADTSICFGESISLANQTPEMSWENTTNAKSPEFYESGTYYFAVTEDACLWIDSISVNVADCEKLVFIPNAFTPDGDGLNDLFRPIIYRQLSAYHLSIMDRWGKILYTTTNYERGWPGTDQKGRSCQAGVYIYRVEFSGVEIETRTRTGHVSLIR